MTAPSLDGGTFLAIQLTPFLFIMISMGFMYFGLCALATELVACSPQPLTRSSIAHLLIVVNGENYYSACVDNSQHA